MKNARLRPGPSAPAPATPRTPGPASLRPWLRWNFRGHAEGRPAPWRPAWRCGGHHRYWPPRPGSYIDVRAPPAGAEQLAYYASQFPAGPGGFPPVLAVTADLAVVRFHGHSEEWASRNIYERFGYLYSEAELRDWVPELPRLAQPAGAHPVV